jgi:hypothetical protein
MRFFHILTRPVARLAALALCLVSAQATTSVHAGESNLVVTGYSAAALFNQANADAREGHPGPAILNYERALLLAPNDADVTANLRLVRAKAGLPDTPQNWLGRTVTCASPNTLAWLGCVGLALAGTTLLVARWYPRRRLAFRSLTFVGASLVVTAMASAVAVWPTVNEAVVIARHAPARTSPVLAAEPAFTLQEGETVRVGAEHQSFVLVHTSAGRSAWVARADLARVVPSAGGRTY